MRLVDFDPLLGVMHQSIPAVPIPPSPGPLGINIFLEKLGKFPGVGTHKVSKCPGVGTRKEGKCPLPGSSHSNTSAVVLLTRQ